MALTARVSNFMARFRPGAKAVTRLHARILRLSGGRLKRSFLLAGGQPVLVLTTTGRKSGKRRPTPLAYLRDGERFVVAASNAGLDSPPAWWLNLQADPGAEVEVGGERRPVRARRARPEEQEDLWRRFVAQYAGFDDYNTFTEREIPLVILDPPGA